MQMTAEKYRSDLVSKISPLLAAKGVKSLTMDSVAKNLGMSKRTLYEIFGSKENMILEAMRLMQERAKECIIAVTSKSQNAMEAMILALKEHQRTMNEVTMDFIRDMDEYFPRLRTTYDQSVATDQMLRGFENGVKEGVFRPEVDYRIMVRLFVIQMESLKRMEEHFPADVTLLQTYNTISLAFLRSIATPKGMKVLEGLYDYFEDPRTSVRDGQD